MYCAWSILGFALCAVATGTSSCQLRLAEAELVGWRTEVRPGAWGIPADPGGGLNTHPGGGLKSHPDGGLNTYPDGGLNTVFAVSGDAVSGNKATSRGASASDFGGVCFFGAAQARTQIAFGNWGELLCREPSSP